MEATKIDIYMGAYTDKIRALVKQRMDEGFGNATIVIPMSSFDDQALERWEVGKPVEVNLEYPFYSEMGVVGKPNSGDCLVVIGDQVDYLKEYLLEVFTPTQQYDLCIDGTIDEWDANYDPDKNCMVIEFL